MEITYYGQSCFLFNIGDTKVLFDPFISGNDLAKDIKVDEIGADYILLSHGHQDHVHDAEAIAKRTGAEIVANWEIATWFQNKGVEKTHPMNTGGKIKRDFGTVRMVHAVHSSSLPDGSYGGTAAGFVVKTEDKTFYFAGDTALTYDMKLISEEYGYKIDFALLPVGDNFTMDAEDAMIAADFVQTNKVIAMHYDTFPYIKVDKDAVKAAAKRAGKELVMLEIGQTIKL
ncbi:MAG: metal-dependent hydrolase [Hymenobacteraceae bacterium]|nr:metal-dependent hydrolase [Hymenobacteraceae bacterium]MDX5397568.1 metal-dependent hydrolase [Hymenobacteraceae bacterium]MDX5444182.1 metal-dependent hydrolase [Hymenobacteraceae bacterium]MDX5513648.1 metal-dependent hydrolase [Hymenobacteraceae bacterium]